MHGYEEDDEIDTGAGGRSVAARGLLTVPLSGITRPGVYVTARGDLVRIASEFMARGSLPSLTSAERVTRVSADPCESISECRRLAAIADLPFNF